MARDPASGHDGGPSRVVVAEEILPGHRVGCGALLDSARVAPAAGLPALLGSDEAAGVHPAAVVPDPGNEQLGDIAIDFDRIGLSGGCDPVMAILDVVVVANLNQVDRGQHGQAIHGPVDALPAGAPVLAAESRQRQEVGGVLGRVAQGADDPVDRDAPDADGSAGRGTRTRMDVVERWEHGPLGLSAGPLVHGVAAPRALDATGDGGENDERREAREEPAEESDDHRPRWVVALRTMMPSPSVGHLASWACRDTEERSLDGDRHLRPHVQAVWR